MTPPGEGENELRIAHCTATGRPILVAPQRRNRPLLTHANDPGAQSCPFCQGEEHQTPPEIDRIEGPGGWRVRAFPNLYPAAPDHEVVVEGARHETRPSAVEVDIWCDALTVYRRRLAALESRAAVQAAFLFKNVGREAGASIPHNHTQIIGLPMLPPRLELELARSRDRCVICEELTTARAQGRVIAEHDDYVAFCPSAPKLPFETWFAPRRHDTDFMTADPDAGRACAAALRELFLAFDRGLDEPAFNLYLHRVPDTSFHWHFEAQPRTGYVAGLELGGDMYINSMSGAEAAARLRVS